ncbi:hypothetical protein DLD82_12145 [Methanospirillum stamsii]|uniref:Uncharacterized protein n=1 Tax=Methanospirillum stamsii TaxID=1277351 RepID=A0A2V2MYF7_9EURY|nr:hypothetical protein DLD82_12145 [Methanospirillum stamsii]
MPVIPSYLTTIAPWEFSAYIAPRDIIRAALPEAVSSYRSVVHLYLNEGSRLFSHSQESGIKDIRITDYEMLISHITNKKGDLLLIECCDEWFGDEPERILEFGLKCKEYSKKRGAVVVLGVKANYIFRTLSPFIGPVQWIKTNSKYAFSQKPLFVNDNMNIYQYGQQTLQV